MRCVAITLAISLCALPSRADDVRERGWSRVGAEIAINFSMGDTDPLGAGSNGGGQALGRGFEGGLFARYELSNYFAFRPELTGVLQACSFDSRTMDSAVAVTREGAVMTAPMVLVLDRWLAQAQFFVGPELGATHTSVTGQLTTTADALMFGVAFGFLLDVGPVSIVLRAHHTFTGIANQTVPTQLESLALGVGYGLKL